MPARALREWMLAAADCTRASFDVCALFDGPTEAATVEAGRGERLVGHVSR